MGNREASALGEASTLGNTISAGVRRPHLKNEIAPHEYCAHVLFRTPFRVDVVDLGVPLRGHPHRVLKER